MAVTGDPGASGYQMASRINLRRDVLVAREDSKPNTINSMAVPIAVCIAVPVAIAIGVLLWLHRRNVKRQRAEDAKDPHAHLDFGMGDAPPVGGGKKKLGRKSILMMGGEKGQHKTNQLSMDMNLESPYLLPPQAQASHDSVHSLTRNYPQEYDPYRMVPSECGNSVRSFNKETGGSVYGSKRNSVVTSRSLKMPPPRQGSFPKSPFSPDNTTVEKEPLPKDPFATPPAAPEPAHQGPAQPQLQEPIVPVKPVVPEIGTVPYPDEKEEPMPRVPSIQEPPPAVAKSPEDRMYSPPREEHQFELPGMAQSSNIGMASGGDMSSPPQHNEPAGLGLNLDLPQPMSPLKDDMFGNQQHIQPQSAQVMDMDNRRSKESDYGYEDAYQPQIRTSEYHDQYEDDGRGRTRHSRMDLDMMQQQQQSEQGLGVPQQDNKRLSIGFRPLPPEETFESEDPEYRANRIRSFYKEYFDDSKEAAPPMPNVPAEYYGGAQYYEDYDEGYLGEAAYYDPDTNAFVMPYAQPVQRRAMTPPPGGRRGPPGPRPRGPPGPGRRGPPCGPHGSLGGMSLPGGPGRPRAGSAWGSRAPSSLGPRPDSSASARAGRATPRKNLPPPSALSTLPTPSKLKDDSFAIFNAADFAPPDTFADRARGRSQSPLGERRAYSPKVPSASPLVSTYDELGAMPSPHDLRKSKTFTNLDFLPPKKFKDNDTMSDAGSIHSNRSGISLAAQSAIRSGAGRVSRLPGDQVFTTHAMSSELKPQWGMRP